MTLELRPVRADDLAAVLALHLRSEGHDGVPRVLTMDELVEEFDGSPVSMETDTVLAELDGRLAGYAYTFHLPSEVREERCYLFGQVEPELRRRGVGTALLRWTIERATAQLRVADHDLPRYIRAEQFAPVEAAAALFAAEGLEPVRWGEELLRPLTDLPTPAVLDGITIVPWDPARSEEIRLVKNAAFMDHWGSTPVSPEFWAQMTEGHGARLDLSFIALDASDGRVVGYSLNKRFESDDELLGRRDAWIENLGTLAEWRGRGIATALIAHSLHAFAAADLTHASIGVDADNPSGAARLYRSLGFEPQARWVTHQLVVAPTGIGDN